MISARNAGGTLSTTIVLQTTKTMPNTAAAHPMEHLAPFLQTLLPSGPARRGPVVGAPGSLSLLAGS